MKPSYFALAVMGFGPCALSAQAQTGSSATVYGVLDAGIVAERGCTSDCASSKVSGGVASGSRLGVQGREALGNDVAAVYTLEAGVLNDTGQSDQDGRLFGRQAYVGLDSRLGALTLGRQYNPQYLALTDVADPFKGGMAGSASNLAGYSVKRYDNTVKYVTPALRGISASAIYSFGETPYSSANNRAYGATIGYSAGAVNISVSHQRKNSLILATSSAPSIDMSARNTLVAANVDLGVATAFAAVGVNKGYGSSPWDPSNAYSSLALSMSSSDSRDTLLGVSVPVSGFKLLASYVHKDDRDLANRDATQFAVGLTYALSKRSDFYASYAKIRNKNGAHYTVGNASDAGRGDSAFNMGFRHGF
ncbi:MULTISPECIES: porin [unclassified Janthinobacterium]|uniref:porin n=1 Tax=unclassified Janthinobacterium TaxID=2610881 RepID=UPI00160FC987|nr:MULTISPECIES: porin [unclassified Janthinobacterium]MBB5610884.1 putative porin [Janthinobacterium sp. S3T4]MBB5616346.1 putative porin [Janthinobacterium sp. S3M3]